MGSGSTAPRAKMVLATLGIAALTAVQPVPVPLGQGGIAHAQEGPQSLADLSDRLIDSVVNISTSQRVSGGERNVPRPRLPEGSPFQEFFDEFFDSLPDGEGPGRGERSVQSLGRTKKFEYGDGVTSVLTRNSPTRRADTSVCKKLVIARGKSTSVQRSSVKIASDVNAIAGVRVCFRT